MATRFDKALTPWAARRPLQELLGTFQILAAVALVPFAVMSPGSRGDLVDGLLVLGWVAQAGLNLVPRIRPARWTFEVALYVAAALTVVQVAVSAREQIAMLAAVELLILGLFAVFCLGGPAMLGWLAASGTGLVIAGALRSPQDAVTGAVVAALIALTAVVVRRLVRQVVDAAEHDSLTGALNRLGLRDRAELVRAYAQRRGEDVCVAVLDLDRFKQYNDRFGHTAGDRLLIDVVARLRRDLRRSDLVARLGGDEFALVLVGADLPTATAVLDRVLPDLPAPCTRGLAAWDADSDLGAALDAADRAMYERKRHAKGGRRLAADA